MKLSLLTLTSVAALTLSSAAADEKRADADNTKHNERDRSGDTLTSGDQSNDPNDLKITREIRNAVVKDDSLSMLAKNVKIITTGGQTTLRGPVHSAEEKQKIESIATSAAGGAKIVNQLEIKADDKK